MDNNSNSDNQNIQTQPNKLSANNRNQKLAIIIAVLLIIISNVGSYLFMNKLLTQKNTKINELSNQANTSNVRIAELEGKIQEMTEKANKEQEQEPKTSSLSFTVTKAEIVNRPNEASTLFITLDLKNISSNNYELKTSDLKVKNNSDNTLEAFFAYPEIYGYSNNAALKDQTINPGESISGFLQIPLTKTETQPQTFNVTFTDNTTGVSTEAKAEAKIRTL